MKDYRTIISKSWPVVKKEARWRRRKREWMAVGAVVLPVVLVAVILLNFDGSSKEVIAESALIPSESREELSLTSELSEARLLKELADQGPILIELEDGTKKLILTRPERLHL